MEILVISKSTGRSYRLALSPRAVLSVILGGLLLLSIIYMNLWSAPELVAIVDHEAAADEQYHQKWKRDIEEQQAQVSLARENAEYSLEVLSAQLSTMRAHLLRLDALGARLIKLANMSEEEFNMDESPGVGGPSMGGGHSPPEVNDFIEELTIIGEKLKDRNEKFSVIESMLMGSNIQAQSLPEGSPVSGGWISSLFGWRSDPMSGKREFHKGVDVAGKHGTDVLSVAAGVVTRAGKYQGYGNMIEISHGDGHITRYAHNQENFVRIGDKVEKGQKIATLGSSGRSTGPHVHFEVIYRDKHIDPKKIVLLD